MDPSGKQQVFLRGCVGLQLTFFPLLPFAVKLLERVVFTCLHVLSFIPS